MVLFVAYMPLLIVSCVLQSFSVSLGWGWGGCIFCVCGWLFFFIAVGGCFAFFLSVFFSVFFYVCLPHSFSVVCFSLLFISFCLSPPLSFSLSVSFSLSLSPRLTLSVSPPSCPSLPPPFLSDSLSHGIIYTVR